MFEETTDTVANRPTPISRRSLLKQGAGVAAATLGAGALAAPEVKRAHAAINEAHFNIVGRAVQTITFGAQGDITAVKQFQPTVDKFNALNPKIHVNLISIPQTDWASLFEVLLTRVAGGTAPDVMRIAIQGIALFGSKKLSLPLNDLMRHDAAYVDELRSDTLPTLWTALAYKGEQLALPFSYNNYEVWYNTRLFSKLGMGRPADNWTGDDFLAMCAKLKKRGIWGTAVDDNDTFFIECWSLAAGADLLNADRTKSTALQPGNLVAWQYLYDLIKTHAYSPIPGKIPEATFFESGRLGTFLSGRWGGYQLVQDHFKDADVQYFPTLNGGPRRTVYGVDGFPIFRSCKYPEAAWEFVKYMSTKPVMYDWTALGTNVPARKSLAYDASFMNPPAHFRQFYDSLSNGLGVPVASPPQFLEMQTAIIKWFTGMLAGQATPQGALTGLDKDLTAILQKPM